MSVYKKQIKSDVFPTVDMFVLPMAKTGKHRGRQLSLPQMGGGGLHFEFAFLKCFITTQW